jgi:hypothetical protein
VLFIGPEKQRTSDQGAYVWWFLPSGSKAVRMSRYYPEGIQKVAYVRWSHVRPLYGLQSVRPVVPSRTSALQTAAYVCPDLAYVRLKVQITPLVSLVTQSPN